MKQYPGAVHSRFRRPHFGTNGAHQAAVDPNSCGGCSSRHVTYVFIVALVCIVRPCDCLRIKSSNVDTIATISFEAGSPFEPVWPVSFTFEELLNSSFRAAGFARAPAPSSCPAAVHGASPHGVAPTGALSSLYAAVSELII